MLVLDEELSATVVLEQISDTPSTLGPDEAPQYDSASHKVDVSICMFDPFLCPHLHILSHIHAHAWNYFRGCNQ
jgi:hypothetical protein